ncbi:MAG: metallophosphoesterase [Deltaproteobacteria bacterium]|nr:metallophosphoesterase [Deltaproteobacteria bacterium]
MVKSLFMPKWSRQNNPADKSTLREQLFSKTMLRKRRRRQGPRGLLGLDKRAFHRSGVRVAKSAGRAKRIVTDSACWLVLGDIHVPYQDPAAIRCVLDILEAHEFTGVVQVGDFIDADTISRFRADDLVAA